MAQKNSLHTNKKKCWCDLILGVKSAVLFIILFCYKQLHSLLIFNINLFG